MNLKIEQRVVIKFLINSGEKLAKIFLKLKKVLLNECASRACIFKRARRFTEGRRYVYDDERPGVPIMVTTNANVNHLHPLLTTDHHLMTQMLSVELGINRETIRQLLHGKLHMRKLCAKLVSKILTNEQKDMCRNICSDLLMKIEEEVTDWMEQVVMGDESWVLQYDPETRRQSRTWVAKREPRLKKARMQRSQMKASSFVFWCTWNCASWIRTTASNSNGEVLPWSFRPLTSANYANASSFSKKWIDFASWQCTGTFISRGMQIFGGKKYSHVATLTLQPDLTPETLFYSLNSSRYWKGRDSMI